MSSEGDGPARKKPRKSRFSSTQVVPPTSGPSAASTPQQQEEQGAEASVTTSTTEQSQNDTSSNIQLVKARAAAAAAAARVHSSSSSSLSSSWQYPDSMLHGTQQRRDANRFKRSRLEGVDEHGNLLRNEGPQKKAKRENPYLAHRKEDNEQADGSTEIDPRIPTKNKASRKQRGLQFVEHGKYIEEAQNLRDYQATQKIFSSSASGSAARPARSQDDFSAGKSGELSSEEIVEKDPELPPRLEYKEIPDLEWWDAAFLPPQKRKERANALAQAKALKGNATSYSYDSLSINNSKAHAYVEHPVPILAPSDSKPSKPVPLMLTKKERKRLRRQNRAERQREMQEKIALGIMAPPEPKVKLTNLMRVLGEQAVADPSSVEKKVRKQMEQRVKNHEMRNQARKLTPEERKEKDQKKMSEDVTGSGGVQVAVFRVKDLSNPRHRFKVDANARQRYLTGMVLMCREPQMNMVVVEGGTRAVKKYMKLMQNRIKWNGDAMEQDDDDDSEGEQMAEGDNRCECVWYGTVPTRNFSGFRFSECRTASSARRAMETRGLVHYWDMCVQNAPWIDQSHLRGIKSASAAASLADQKNEGDDLWFLDNPSDIENKPSEKATTNGEQQATS
eukprot:gb/GECG01015453.1/.p1 GENE.gb/GECG01015453.1/~~gb/GECG01015453.1/.p1  ORF type:complete len:619 (+),score=116.34 gb/GECG01015453.1/:1-1857(+)